MEDPHQDNPDFLPLPADDLQRLGLTAEQVYRDYAPRIFNVARRMVHNEKDAEDIAQDVFLQVVRKLPTFRGDSALPTWLHRVTVNVALAHRRKQAVREDSHAADSLEDLLEEGQRPWSERPGTEAPDELLMDRELQQLVNRAIARLPETYRQVLMLSDLEGLSHAEVGTRMGLSIPAIKSRLHRARLLLRDRLAPHFEESLV